MDLLIKSLVGFFVGSLIGMTGVGGGVLLLPILIFGLHVPAMRAVGSDALFNFATKIGASIVHLRKGTVRRKVVLALIVIPYFDINIESEGVWLRNRERRLRIFIGVLVAFTAVMLVFHVYAVLIPTLAIAAFMLAAAAGAPEHSGFRRWLVSKPLSFWIMTWFLVQAGILTAIGTFFRGAGWSWVWPWRS